MSFREELLRRFGKAGGEELRAILQECDPVLFHEALLRWAGRRERRGDEAQAISVYRFLSESNAGDSLVSLAKRRLAVLSGSGPTGDRVEYLLSHFSKQAIDPAPLLALGAASLAFRAARGASLAGLLQAPAGFWTRGGRARLAAGLSGFGAEVFAFAGGTRAMNAVLGRDMDWSAGALQAELAGGALFLGAIKGFGLAGKYIQPSVPGGPAVGGAMRQAFLLVGIHSGQALEAAAGFREPGADARAWLDSLALLLGLNVAARLSRALLGSRFTAWERELDFRSAAWVGTGPSEGMPGRTAAAVVSGLSVPVGRSAELSPVSAKAVFMSAGSKHGDSAEPPSRPSSSFPPRSSDFFSKGGPGLVQVRRPPPQFGEILDLLLSYRPVEPELLTRAARKMDWLMPEERGELLDWALRTHSAEFLVGRLSAMATQSASRGAAVHALRLLLSLQAGEKAVSPLLATRVLNEIGEVLSPDPEKSGALRWKIAETRLLYALEALVSSGPGAGGRAGLAFEMELARLARNGFSRPFFDDLLYFSLEVRSSKTRYLLANSAVGIALGPIGRQGAMRDFMNGYYVVSRLAETGHLTKASSVAQLMLMRGQSWDVAGLPKEHQVFLRRRLKFQHEVIAQYAGIVKDAQPESMQRYYETQAAHGQRHLPESWGLIGILREHAALLHAQQGNMTMSAMLRLQAAECLFRDAVLDPVLAKAVQAVPELAVSRQSLLELVEDLPARTRVESQEPLQAIFNALASRQEWREAYQLLDAVYHLQLADPSFLRSLHASLLVNLDIARHRAAGTPEFETLSLQMKRFTGFEARFFY